jgi:hypothetical protein
VVPQCGTGHKELVRVTWNSQKAELIMKTAEDLLINTRVIAKASAVGCDVEGEMVLLDLDSDTYFGLNPVGADIWNYIREEKSLQEIQSYLLSRYKVSRERCEQEVRVLLTNLAAKGLIETRPDEIPSLEDAETI